MSEGKFKELISKKRAYLKATVKDYSDGANDMLDDVSRLLNRAIKEFPQEVVNPGGTVQINNWFFAVKKWEKKYLGAVVQFQSSKEQIDKPHIKKLSTKFQEENQKEKP